MGERAVLRSVVAVTAGLTMLVGVRLPALGAGGAGTPIVRVLGTTTTTLPPTTTTLPAELPTLAPAHEDGGKTVIEPEIVVGTLSIPKLGVDQTLYEGLTLSSINRGPSHWPGTALPGFRGNVVVAGHRTTYSKPFRHMDALVPGDEAIFTTDAGTFTYHFVTHEIVTPDRVDVLDQTPDHTATFFACHPPGSARYRIVARWVLVSTPADLPPPTTTPSSGPVAAPPTMTVGPDPGAQPASGGLLGFLGG